MAEGVTGIDYGIITPSSATITITASHSLGAIPSVIIVIDKNMESQLDDYYPCYTPIVIDNWAFYIDGSTIARRSSYINKTASSFTVTAAASWKFEGTYYWFAIA